MVDHKPLAPKLRQHQDWAAWYRMEAILFILPGVVACQGRFQAAPSVTPPLLLPWIAAHGTNTRPSDIKGRRCRLNRIALCRGSATPCDHQCFFNVPACSASECTGRARAFRPQMEKNVRLPWRRRHGTGDVIDKILVFRINIPFFRCRPSTKLWMCGSWRKTPRSCHRRRSRIIRTTCPPLSYSCKHSYWLMPPRVGRAHPCDGPTNLWVNNLMLQ